MTLSALARLPPHLWIAIGGFLLHLIYGGGFGYHHDELYFVACGHRPAWGYVDQPPLVPWIAAVSDWMFGGSLRGLRLFPMLASSASIYLAGTLAGRLGGGNFARGVAATAFLIAPVYLRTGNLLCIPVFEPLLWLSASYLLVRIVQEQRPRLWLAIGVIAGIGLLTKHTMLLFGFGLVLGLLLTDLRSQLLSRWIWLGGAIAAALFAPNLIWQVQNDWATVEFVRDLNQGTMSRISKGEFLIGQLLYLNPVSAPLWLAGLGFYFTAQGRRYRVLGWIYVATLGVLLVAGSKIYYLAPAYPVLLSAGGVQLERWLAARQRGWRVATLVWLAIGGLALAPVSLPILSIDATDRYVKTATFGALENVYELTGDLHDQFGWQQLTALAEQAYATVPASERATTIVLTFSRANAAALDFFGDELPPARSGDLAYHLWGWGDNEPTTVVTVGVSRENLERMFGDVTEVGVFNHPHVNPRRNGQIVAVGRQPKMTMAELWPRIKTY